MSKDVTMWQIDNRTPFAAAQSWLRGINGAETWVVVVRATYTIAPDGSLEISEIQPDVVRTPVYIGEAGKSSIRYDSDFVLGKPRTDVILNGHACAPTGTAVRVLDVGLQIGEIRKRLRVSGDRHFTLAGVSEPEPWQRMPLVYERAYGGRDQRSDQPNRDWSWANPVGVGFVADRARATGVALPNIEYPEQQLSTWKSRPSFAGFGAIGGSWEDRAAFAGTYDAAWELERQPLLPNDYDIQHNQCAPRDQQLTQPLRAGEIVRVINCRPEGVLSFRIPDESFTFLTRFKDGTSEQRVPNLHTVIIEPDYPSVSLVWHSALECHSQVYQLQDTLITSHSGSGDDFAENPIENLFDVI